MSSTREKVLTYLKGRKQPVTTEFLCHHFLMSTGAIRKALYALEADGEIARIPAPPKPHAARWLWRAVRRPVAIPRNPDPTQRSQPTTVKPIIRPIQNSYPTVRGYDD